MKRIECLNYSVCNRTLSCGTNKDIRKNIVKVRYIEFLNKGKSNRVKRQSFNCLEVTIDTDSKWFRSVYNHALDIEKKLNLSQANTSEVRNSEIVRADNLSGLIAEYACVAVLKAYLDVEISKSESDSAKDQIDVLIGTKNKTIEVRSSFVRNGIDFALFYTDSNGIQYFDVLGPYSNGYKPGESLKNYYMRVLYAYDKNNFLDEIKKDEIKLYITGGVTDEMLLNKSIVTVKHLVPAGGEVKIESDYLVVPICNSLDFKQFLESISDDIKK